MAVIIAGFGSNDRVPGAYGEVLYGTSGQTAASLPLLCLLVGLALSAGTIAVDTQVQQVFSKQDMDTYAGAGGELAWMGYDAIDAAPSTPIYIASPKAAGGAVAATGGLMVAGTWTIAGQLVLRVGGKAIPLPVASTDTPTTFATNAVLVINGALQGRCPVTATSTAGLVTLTWKTPGARGNQAELALDTTSMPSGMTASVTGFAWVTATAYPVNSYVVPTVANGFYYKATAITGTGTSGASQPTWPTTIGTTVVDNSGPNQITWTCWGAIETGGIPQLGGGSGTETYTNLLSTLLTSQFDRIGLAANDSTSLAAWKTQIDSQAAAPVNILQHVICASNGSYSSAQSIASSATLNDQRFQVLWCLNAETHPSRIAGAFAATRAQSEQADPDAAYNNFTLPTVAPMTQKADWPSHAQLVTALNNGVTPLSSNGGQTFVIRSITTHSTTGGNADYSTLDTGQASVPDFVLKDLRLYWVSVFAVQNPRVQDDPAPGQRNPPSGVAYPALWTSNVNKKLSDYSIGNLTGATGTGSQVPPIILAPQPGDVTSNFDNVAKRIMTAATVRPAPNDCQVGISVRQAA